MKCPVCPDSTLLMSDRQGVEIDYCPSCRGVWLDRGELDKLVQLAANQAPAPVQQPAPAPAYAQQAETPTRLEGVTVTDSTVEETYGTRELSSPKATAAIVDTDTLEARIVDLGA